MIVTIDGPAGSGKSAAAVLLAERLGVPHLDTGAMYRAIALDALEQGLLDDPAALARRCRQLDLRFDWSRRPAPLFLNGHDVSDAIREPRVTAVTFRAADNQAVRDDLVRRQREIGQTAGSLVTEGRDQGSVVFPDAAFKFYLDAQPSERARRRIAQLAAKGIHGDYDKILTDLLERDARDRARPVGGLYRTADARLIDTTSLSLPEVVEKLYQIVTAGDKKQP